MNFDEIEEKYKELISLAKEMMIKNTDLIHDDKHMLDVVEYTKKLIFLLRNKFDINEDVCIISAYWHDVGRIKVDSGHEALSAKMLREKMIELNYESSFIDKCVLAIEKHKWDMMPESIEGFIIKDADKLAWIGSRRWKNCISEKYKLDEIVSLLPKLRSEILYFDESKNIYDQEIIRLVKILHCCLFDN